MPTVRIELLVGRTHRQKAEAAAQVTEALARTLKVSAHDVRIVFCEIKESEFALGGRLLDDAT